MMLLKRTKPGQNAKHESKEGRQNSKKQFLRKKKLKLSKSSPRAGSYSYDELGNASLYTCRQPVFGNSMRAFVRIGRLVRHARSLRCRCFTSVCGAQSPVARRVSAVHHTSCRGGVRRCSRRLILM